MVHAPVWAATGGTLVLEVFECPLHSCDERSATSPFRRALSFCRMILFPSFRTGDQPFSTYKPRRLAVHCWEPWPTARVSATDPHFHPTSAGHPVASGPAGLFPAVRRATFHQRRVHCCQEALLAAQVASALVAALRSGAVQTSAPETMACHSCFWVNHQAAALPIAWAASWAVQSSSPQSLARLSLCEASVAVLPSPGAPAHGRGTQNAPDRLRAWPHARVDSRPDRWYRRR